MIISIGNYLFSLKAEKHKSYYAKIVLIECNYISDFN